jgi:hypothetical protein
VTVGCVRLFATGNGGEWGPILVSPYERMIRVPNLFRLSGNLPSCLYTHDREGIII